MWDSMDTEEVRTSGWSRVAKTLVPKCLFSPFSSEVEKFIEILTMLNSFFFFRLKYPLLK